jgi:hypothetical protein
MSVLTASGLPVARAAIHLPSQGRGWIEASLNLAVGLEPKEAVSLDFETGETIETTCARTWLDGGFLQVMLQLGAGKLGQVVPQKFYEGISAATVIRDLLYEIGEVPGQINAPQILTQWVRVAGNSASALSSLCSSIGMDWRVGTDGKVHVVKAVPKETFYIEALEVHQREARFYLEPSLEPFSHTLEISHDGEVFTVIPRAVRHQVSSKELITEVVW